MGITSTGSGKAPRRFTFLEPSTMQMKSLATAATIFSRVSAPPPPLIISRCSLTSSAPSTYTGRRSTSFSVSTGMPWPRRRSAVASELATAPAMRSFMAARPSMKKLAVEPVPTPTTSPSGT